MHVTKEEVEKAEADYAAAYTAAWNARYAAVRATAAAKATDAAADAAWVKRQKLKEAYEAND